MKSDLRKEIDQILNDKLNMAIKEFRAQRDQDLEALVALKKAIGSLEAERADVQKQMGSLNTKKSSGLAEHNRLTQKLNWLDRQIKGKRGQVNVLMAKLTGIEIDPKMLNLILTYHKKEGGESEKD